MCGIAGIYNPSGQVEKETIKAMTDSIAHRGPDGEGQWLSTCGRVGLGHRRLSILDLSEAGAQPMQYHNRFTLTFNGEIYNYIEIRNELKGKGYLFESGTDSEVLIAAYEHWGRDCLSRFDGMFAFAIWDEVEEQLFCARDRFGEKPFYFSAENGNFYFASEMKSIFAAGLPKAKNDAMLFKYLAYDVVSDYNDPESTFYKGIKKLPAATAMLVDSSGNINTWKYWSLEVKSVNPPSFDLAVEQFAAHFETSIARRLRSDVAVGSSLSGGLDSSSIVLIIDKLLNQNKQHTFSARFDDPALDEGSFMKMVTDGKQIDAHEVWPSSDMLVNNLEKLFWHQEEPFGSASILAQWSVMELAKEKGVTVLLDGQGADETLGGYIHYYRPFFQELYLKNNALFESEQSAYSRLFNKQYPKNWRFYAEARMPSLVRGIGKVRRKLSNPGYLQKVNPDFAMAFQNDPPPFADQPHLNTTLLHATLGYGLEKLLRFSDRNAMAHGREVRLPFLNHELVEFLFTLPSNYKIRGGWTKRLLRESMKGILPEAITWRKEKLGFKPPQGDWMKNTKLRERVNDSKSTLVKEKIIQSQSKISDWSCLMAGQFMNVIEA